MSPWVETVAGPLAMDAEDLPLARWLVEATMQESARAEIAWLRGHCQAGDSVVDVGAAFGHLMLILARHVGPAGHVLAIEPHPRLCRLLRATLARHRLAHVTVVTAAAGCRAGRGTFLAHPSAFEGIVREER